KKSSAAKKKSSSLSPASYAQPPKPLKRPANTPRAPLDTAVRAAASWYHPQRPAAAPKQGRAHPDNRVEGVMKLKGRPPGVRPISPRPADGLLPPGRHHNSPHLSLIPPPPPHRPAVPNILPRCLLHGPAPPPISSPHKPTSSTSISYATKANPPAPP